jgi:hypothetical protein
LRKILLLLVAAFCLFAHKDAVIFGIAKSYGSGDSIQNSAFENKKTRYDISTSSTVYKIGTHFNIDRAHQYKGKWVFVYEKKDIDFKKDGKTISKGGYKTGVEYSWGKTLGILLNDEIIPFVKFGFAFGTFGTLGDFNEANYGLGIEFDTKYFEIEIGAERKNREWGGWRTAFELFKEDYNDAEEYYYLDLNFRF